MTATFSRLHHQVFALPSLEPAVEPGQVSAAPGAKRQVWGMLSNLDPELAAGAHGVTATVEVASLVPRGGLSRQWAKVRLAPVLAYHMGFF